MSKLTIMVLTERKFIQNDDAILEFRLLIIQHIDIQINISQFQRLFFWLQPHSADALYKFEIILFGLFNISKKYYLCTRFAQVVKLVDTPA